MKNRRFFILCAAAAGLAGCGGLAPYATAPLPAPAGTHDPGRRVGICYDGLASSAAEVRAAAQQECGPGAQAILLGTDWRLENCPVLLASRATFACKPKK